HLIEGNALLTDLIDDGVDAAGQRKIGGGFITLRLGVAGVQLLITTLITHGITLVTSGNEIGPAGTDNGALDVVGEGINSNVFVRFVADARDDYGWAIVVFQFKITRPGERQHVGDHFIGHQLGVFGIPAIRQRHFFTGIQTGNFGGTAGAQQYRS